MRPPPPHTGVTVLFSVNFLCFSASFCPGRNSFLVYKMFRTPTQSLWPLIPTTHHALTHLVSNIPATQSKWHFHLVTPAFCLPSEISELPVILPTKKKQTLNISAGASPFLPKKIGAYPVTPHSQFMQKTKESSSRSPTLPWNNINLLLQSILVLGQSLLDGWKQQKQYHIGSKGSSHWGNTCVAGLSLSFGSWGAINRKFRGDQAFFMTVSHEFRFVLISNYKRSSFQIWFDGKSEK